MAPAKSFKIADLAPMMDFSTNLPVKDALFMSWISEFAAWLFKIPLSFMVMLQIPNNHGLNKFSIASSIPAVAAYSAIFCMFLLTYSLEYP